MTIAPLTKRLVKGSGLTNAEGDANWTTIENFVNALAAQIAGALNDDGSIKAPTVVRAASGELIDDYAITVDGSYDSAADLVGLIIVMHADVPNDDLDATLTVNATIGPMTIRKLAGENLATGDIRSNQECILTYDPINSVLILHNPSTNSRVNYVASSSGTVDFVVSIADVDDNTFELPEDWYAGWTGFFTATSTLAAGTHTFQIVSVAPALSYTAKSFKKYGAGGKVALEVGDITAGNTYQWMYDGTDVVLLNPNPDPIIYRGAATAFSAGYSKVFDGVSHGLGGVPDFAFVMLVWKADNITSGYVSGDQVPAVCLEPGISTARPHPFVISFTATTFTLVHTNPGAVHYFLSNKGGTAEAEYSDAQLVTDWNVRVILGRYKRATTGAIQ